MRKTVITVAAIPMLAALTDFLSVWLVGFSMWYKICRTSHHYRCWGCQSQFREEWWRPPRWLRWLLLCNCTDSGMWLGRMRCIFHPLKGGSNQPQSLASSTWAFESQCFISEHKLLDRVSLLPKVVFRGKRDHGEGRRSRPWCLHMKCIWSGFLFVQTGGDWGCSNHKLQESFDRVQFHFARTSSWT